MLAAPPRDFEGLRREDEEAPVNSATSASTFMLTL